MAQFTDLNKKTEREMNTESRKPNRIQTEQHQSKTKFETQSKQREITKSRAKTIKIDTERNEIQNKQTES